MRLQRCSNPERIFAEYLDLCGKLLPEPSQKGKKFVKRQSPRRSPNGRCKLMGDSQMGKSGVCLDVSALTSPSNASRNREPAVLGVMSLDAWWSSPCIRPKGRSSPEQIPVQAEEWVLEFQGIKMRSESRERK